MTVTSVGAAAQETPEFALPSPLEGYETETIGAVTWTFPESERGRVAELIEGFDDHWAKVVSDFGEVIDDELVIRVARNPREMRAMAPIGHPPPDYATGVAYSRWGVILLTMSAPQTWEPPDLEVVLVHELSHVALYRAVLGNPMRRDPSIRGSLASAHGVPSPSSCPAIDATTLGARQAFPRPPT
jgi:hypothetical protein